MKTEVPGKEDTEITHGLVSACPFVKKRSDLSVRSLYAPALQSLCVERIASYKVPPIFTEKPLWVCYGQIWALPNRGITYTPDARVGGDITQRKRQGLLTAGVYQFY